MGILNLEKINCKYLDGCGHCRHPMVKKKGLLYKFLNPRLKCLYYFGINNPDLDLITKETVCSIMVPENSDGTV